MQIAARGVAKPSRNPLREDPVRPKQRTIMFSKFRHTVDCLDRKVLDEARTEARARTDALIESGSDEDLEALRRRELMEIASYNGLVGKEILQRLFPENGDEPSGKSAK